MNVETGTEAMQFPEEEYINGIFVAVWHSLCSWKMLYVYPWLPTTWHCLALLGDVKSQLSPVLPRQTVRFESAKSPD